MNDIGLLSLVDSRDFRELFITELGWNNPDQPPTSFEVEGRAYTLIQVAGFKGLRIWYCAELPPRRIQRVIDDLVGKDSHERLVIFAEPQRQEWRWPRRAQLGAANAKLLVHQHLVSEADAHLVKQLKAIAIDFEEDISLVELLAKMRLAFDAEADEASVQAARLMGLLYTELDAAGANERDATLLLARLLFLLFGDHTGMWTAGMFYEFLNKYTDSGHLNEQLHALFEVLNTAEDKRALSKESPFASFRYINGGLFADPLTIVTLADGFREALLAACEFDWGIISPAVFGSMFQTVKSKESRRSGGEHYTSEVNILKTIRPLFLDEYTARLHDAWNSEKALSKLHSDLQALRFLDPACGCGNFLIVAYRELRALELDLIKRKRALDIEQGRVTVASRGQLSFDVTGDIRVTLDHFYGIEIEEWPARIAETAMLLVDHLANQRMEQDFGLAPDRLPIRIAPTIIHDNALTLDWNAVLPASDDVRVFGNPPFHGHKERSKEETGWFKSAWGSDYNGNLDFVTAWHAKSLTYLRKFPKSKFAFVTTNSIVQGQSVAHLFQPIYRDGWRISFAHRPFAWQSEAPGAAAVHCVITGFDRGKSRARLFDYAKPLARPDEVEVSRINAYLLDREDTFVGGRSLPLSPELTVVSSGSNPIDFKQLVLTDEAHAEVLKDATAAKYLRQFSNGSDFINGDLRWCLWLKEASPEDIASSPLLRGRVEELRRLRGAADRVATKKLATTPTLFGEDRQPTETFLAFPQTFTDNRAYMTVGYIEPTTIIGMKIYSTIDPDGFQFAVASSSMMLAWQRTVGGRLKSDPSFSNTLVWNTFPLPQVSPEDRAKITSGGQEVLRARVSSGLPTLGQMYEPSSISSDLLNAHDLLDSAVDAVFGFESRPTTPQRQDRLFSGFSEMSSANQLSVPKRRRSKKE